MEFIGDLKELLASKYNETFENELQVLNSTTIPPLAINRNHMIYFVRFVDILGMDFSIYDKIEMAQDGMERRKTFKKIAKELKKNHDAIKTLFVVIKNIERKANLEMMQILNINQETHSYLKDIRLEIRDYFQQLQHSFNDPVVGNKISSLIGSIKQFWFNVDALNELPRDDWVAELEKPDNILDEMIRSTKPDGILSVGLTEILDKKLAYPKNVDDNSETLTLDVLYFGLQTYVSSYFVILREYNFLANLYYEQGRIDKYNECFDKIIPINADMNILLNQNSLIEKVVDTIAELCEFGYIKRKTTFYNSLLEKKDALEQLRKLVLETTLSITLEQPKVVTGRPVFGASSIETPFGVWKDGEKVSYAVQLRSNNIYSKISEWSEPFEINGKASPQFQVPIAESNKTRLLYRKFDNSTPVFIGAIENSDQTDFRDINRDLYDAAREFDENKAMEEVEILIRNGANVDAVFEGGRKPIHAAAQAGNANLARKFLLNSNATDINAKDRNGFTAMHIATALGYEDFVELLLEAKANIDTTDSALTALHIAAFNGHNLVLKALMKTGDLYLNARQKHGYSPLHFAIFGGFSVFETLLSNDSVDLNAKSNAGFTPLHLAILNEYPDIIELLLKSQKLDINATAKGDFTALHFAVFMDIPDLIRRLCSQKEINVNAASIFGWTPLHYAVELQKKNAILELLACSNVNVNTRADEGVTPLHLAANSGQKDNVILLLEKGAEIEAATKTNYTALHLAAVRGHLDVLNTLIEHAANMEAKTSDNSTPLLLAASSKSGNINALKYLIEKRANTRAYNDKHESFISLAARFGSVELVKYVIETFDALHEVTSTGDTLLHSAVRGRNMEVVKYLIEEKQSTVNIENRKSETPLCIARKNADSDLINYLTEKQGNYIVIYCNTPLENAVRNEDMDFIKYFVETNQTDAALLPTAANYNHVNLIKYLVEKKIDLNSKDANQKSALHYAVSHSNVDLMKYLIENGANVNVIDGDKRIPLHTAIFAATERFELDSIKYLIEKGAAINAQDSDGRTPLHYAVSRSFKIPKFLIENGADISIEDNNGNTPLKYCYDEDLKPFLISDNKIHALRSMQSNRFIAEPHNIKQIPIKEINGIAQSVHFKPLIEQLSKGSQQFNNAPQTGRSSAFLTAENLAFISCVADTLEQSASKRYHRLKCQGIHVVPNTNIAVYDAHERFHEFVEEKIGALSPEVQSKIRVELEMVDLDIIESLMRGIEFSGLVGLDHVLKECKKCFEDNLLRSAIDLDGI